MVGLGIVYEAAEGDVVAEEWGMAHQNEVLAGPGHGHIELAVDDGTIAWVHVFIVGEEGKLVLLLCRETVDDDITLAALVTLDGVDADVVQHRYMVGIDGLTDGRDLIAVRHNDTHGMRCRESI